MMPGFFHLLKACRVAPAVLAVLFATLPGFGAEISNGTAVRVQPVVYSTNAIPVRASGVLARKREADLSFKTGGIVESVFVRVGVP